MSTANTALPSSTSSADEVMVRSVTIIAGVVVGLTFIFGFGNIWMLALRLGVPAWVAPLVAPAVDLSILGLLLGTRHLALNGATSDQLQPARRLLIFSSVVTLALNVADPLIAGELGKAAFDSVGPLLLIGWAEVGPGLLQAIGAVRRIAISPMTVTAADEDDLNQTPVEAIGNELQHISAEANTSAPELSIEDVTFPTTPILDGDLLERAKRADARHWA